MTDATIASVKDILSPGWREDWRDRWGMPDTGQRSEPCTMDGCTGRGQIDGLCTAHYQRRLKARRAA